MSDVFVYFSVKWPLTSHNSQALALTARSTSRSRGAPLWAKQEAALPKVGAPRDSKARRGSPGRSPRS